MPIWTLAASFLLAAQGAPSPVAAEPSEFDAVAADVAFVSDVCYRLIAGELRWAPRDVSEEIALIEAAGLTYGIPNGVIDSLGQTGRISVNRATMASRSRGSFDVILAVGGQIPGCRVMLAGDNTSGLADALAASLVAGGWTALDAFTSSNGAFEQRMFLRSREGRWYRLDLALRTDQADQLRVLIGVSPATTMRPN